MGKIICTGLGPGDPDLMSLRAHRAVNNAVTSGRLVKQPCARCGSTAYVHGHHEDYSKPLDVEWLCRSCHRQHHELLRKSA